MWISLYCNFSYSLLGIETPIGGCGSTSDVELQFLLLPIRDWNLLHPDSALSAYDVLQFLLLPIRDWNKEKY